MPHSDNAYRERSRHVPTSDPSKQLNERSTDKYEEESPPLAGPHARFGWVSEQRRCEVVALLDTHRMALAGYPGQRAESILEVLGR
jgi:hypothetical protein